MKLNLPTLLGDDELHPVYLPFSASTLSRHFAPLSIPGMRTAEDYLRYYRESVLLLFNAYYPDTPPLD